MKTIIAGSRTFNDYDLLKQKLDYFRKHNSVTEIVSGTAKGADQLGERYATENNIRITLFAADWNRHGKKAGPMRNRTMAEYADQLIAVWNGESKGTKNMIENMNRLKKPVYIVWIGSPITAYNA